MRKELYLYQGQNFEIKTISEANSVENSDLIVILKHSEKLLEFYHAHSEVVGYFKHQNKADLEDLLYDIAKSEIKSKFFEMLSTQ